MESLCTNHMAAQKRMELELEKESPSKYHEHRNCCFAEIQSNETTDLESVNKLALEKFCELSSICSLCYNR